MDNKINIDSNFSTSNTHSEVHSNEITSNNDFKKSSFSDISSIILEANRSSLQNKRNERVTINRKSAFHSCKNKKNLFEIIKEFKTIPKFDQKNNYYLEYCDIFLKNEHLIEKIKELSAEIEKMNSVIQINKNH